MATISEQLAELKRELAELAKQAERLAGLAREISDRLGQPIHLLGDCGNPFEGCRRSEDLRLS